MTPSAFYPSGVPQISRLLRTFFFPAPSKTIFLIYLGIWGTCMVACIQFIILRHFSSGHIILTCSKYEPLILGTGLIAEYYKITIIL